MFQLLFYWHYMLLPYFLFLLFSFFVIFPFFLFLIFFLFPFFAASLRVPPGRIVLSASLGTLLHPRGTTPLRVSPVTILMIPIAENRFSVSTIKARYLYSMRSSTSKMLESTPRSSHSMLSDGYKQGHTDKCMFQGQTCKIRETLQGRSQGFEKGGSTKYFVSVSFSILAKSS